jgi:hypothetical protein
MCKESTVFGYFEILILIRIAITGLYIVAILSPNIKSRIEIEVVGNYKILNIIRQVNLVRPQIQISIRLLNELQ